ncbi:MAG: tetratricopeptide repeat protein [Roseiflexaceae bacterium]|nr:tetratricopeptide repeat protein [Roseiflexaceae bacterium]
MLEEYQRDEALLYFQRGLVLERSHRVEEAVAAYRRAIARNPHLREAHDALGYYYQRYGLMAKAVEEFRVVANLEDDFLSHFNLGYALLEMGRHEPALAAFSRCLELLPDDPATHYEVAFLQFLRADYLTAIAHLHKALLVYREDWEIYKLLGRCMLRLGRFDDAQAAFTQAQTYAVRPAARSEIATLLASVTRLRDTGEFTGVKRRLYAEHGVVYLGSAQDDGLTLSEAEEYHFTYPDIATTLRRLAQLVRGCGWHFTCVTAADRLAAPLASAIAQLLDLAECGAEALPAHARPLIVMAVGREYELLDVARERTGGTAVSFCLGLNWLRHSQNLPEISGMLVRGACSVPWEPELRRLRAVGAPPAQIQRCLQIAAAQIAAAADDIAEDATLDAQVQFYTQQHTNLRFA